MARYQIILAYDGTDFQGFQRQGNRRTVQSVLETALKELGWDGKSITAAGRTDAGVHAAGQVVVFDLHWKHNTEDLCGALNARLPQDVSVRSVCQERDDFHARFDARLRRYRYSIYCEQKRNPLYDRFAWQVWPAPDVDAMNRAAAGLIGTHDFAAFGSPYRPQGSTIRTVFQAIWTPLENGLRFEYAANAFLYHMVRRSVYLMAKVGQGRLEPEAVSGAFEKDAPTLPPGLAPACGLTLWEVRYQWSEQEQQLIMENEAIRTFLASGDRDCGKNLRH